MKFTSKVRRGLALMRSLVASMMDDRQPPPAEIVRKWPKRYQQDFNAALEWIEENEKDPDDRARPIGSGNGPGAQLAATQRGAVHVKASIQAMSLHVEGDDETIRMGMALVGGVIGNVVDLPNQLALPLGGES